VCHPVIYGWEALEVLGDGFVSER
jgi:hypothetical protein